MSYSLVLGILGLRSWEVWPVS